MQCRLSRVNHDSGSAALETRPAQAIAHNGNTFESHIGQCVTARL